MLLLSPKCKDLTQGIEKCLTKEKLSGKRSKNRQKLYISNTTASGALVDRQQLSADIIPELPEYIISKKAFFSKKRQSKNYFIRKFVQKRGNFCFHFPANRSSEMHFRIDGNGYNDASSVTELYHQSRSSLSRSDRGGGGGHLTGEMIRQINALQKQQQKQQSFAASFADIQRQQLQMQATYERVLREKTYLKQVPPAAVAKSSSSSTGGGVTAGPVFSARDRGQANLSETRLASRNIACFEVGGEKRCCLPQILNSVLDQVSLNAIHAACDELQIYCSTCTPEQLDVLKLSKIIPNTASQCGLITKSDAERLCSKLLESRPPMASNMGFHATASPFSFRVQHECFGKCRGIVLPEAYTSPSARCIECLDCEGLFCPAKFVTHSHRNRENRTCHWGFDSANWRAYLHLADDYTESEQDKLAKTVADFKARYTNGTNASINNSQKRKSVSLIFQQKWVLNKKSCQQLVDPSVQLLKELPDST